MIPFRENKEGEGIGIHSKQNQMPSVFFEEILEGLETKTNDLAEKIENCEVFKEWMMFSRDNVVSKS